MPVAASVPTPVVTVGYCSGYTVRARRPGRRAVKGLPRVVTGTSLGRVAVLA